MPELALWNATTSPAHAPSSVVAGPSRAARNELTGSISAAIPPLATPSAAALTSSVLVGTSSDMAPLTTRLLLIGAPARAH
jgi:hypothetical protein